MNFYQILRVDQDANVIDIEANYQFLKKKITDPLEVAKIECAYEVLTTRRAEYDTMMMLGENTQMPELAKPKIREFTESKREIPKTQPMDIFSNEFKNRINSAQGTNTVELFNIIAKFGVFFLLSFLAVNVLFFSIVIFDLIF